MTIWTRWIITAGLAAQLAIAPLAMAEDAKTLYDRGIEASNNGQFEQALQFFKEATAVDPNHIDAYYNLGAINYQLKRYPEALEAFNRLLQKDPDDYAARYNTGTVYEKMGRVDEAIAAYELINQTSSRYQKAQARIAELQQQKKGLTTTTQPTSTGQSSSIAAGAGSSTTSSTGNKSVEDIKSSLESLKSDETAKSADTKTTDSAKKPQVQEVATGFYGPTGVAVGNDGTLYVANYSKNSVYKVNSEGKKTLLASGTGINGPVGMVMDTSTGKLYVANHLDNSISEISPNGKVSVIATGLKKPYNLVMDQSSHSLYVTQQETNSIAKIQLNQ